ncbi:hypothetical protein AWS15_01555 [Enterobacter hormaechei subsp. steigerwaltii]|nr:hypothetical protein AWS15_01555 [Enterobacter hormaechei subsp. steigerwaltii]
MNPSLTDSRRQALRSASHWYAVLSGERVSPQQEARWQQWYEQDQDNQWAWQQVENLRNQLGGVPGDVASRALHDTRLTRRHVMKGLLGNDSNLLIVFYVQIMPDDFVMQLHRF